MDLLILAGGMGSRFGGLKQIEPMHKNGEFILDYSIYDAIKAGFDRVVFLIKRETYDIFRETVGKRIENKIAVEYAFQDIDNLPNNFKVPEGRVKPWGTAHAIWCCKDIIRGNFAIINADDFYGRDCFMVLAKSMKENTSNKQYCSVGFKVKNTITENGTVKRGVIKVDNAGKLVSIDESNVGRKGDKIFAESFKDGIERELSEECLVSMNVWGFKNNLFHYIDKKFPAFLNTVKDNPLKSEYLIPDVIDELVKSNEIEVQVVNTSSSWYGMTYKEDKDSVVNAINKMVAEGEYPDNLWN